MHVLLAAQRPGATVARDAMLVIVEPVEWKEQE
jgi:hypothetical protein